MLAMQNRYCLVFIVVFLLDSGGNASAQTPSPRARASSSASLVFLHVRDSGGRLLGGVRVTVDGPTSGEFTTDAEGVVRLQSVRDGVYRLRFEKTGFVAEERTVTIRGGQPDVI